MKLTLDEHLSPHFTVGEFFRSGTAIRLGIDNNPDAHPGEGISTAAVGGVWNSQHLKGEAADIFVPDTATAMRYGHILERHSAVQQLLLEPMGIQQKRWIHVGFRRSE